MGKQISKMDISFKKITLKPKSYQGKWSIGLIIAFFVFLGIFFLFIKAGERGSETYFSNLKLTIPFTLAWLSAIASFIVGLISIIKNQERSAFVYLPVLLGFLILLWVIAEILFPH